VRICFLADAGSVNTRSFVEHFSEKLGHDVHVVTLSPAGDLAPSVTVHDLSVVAGEPGLAGRMANVGSLPRVRRVVRSIAPDLVVGYRVASYGFLGAMSGFHPLVVVAQSQLIVTKPYRSPKKLAVRMTLKRADLVHAWAPHMTRRLVELGAEPEKTLTHPRGIDLERFPPRGSGKDESSVILTRTLHWHYRAQNIIRALAMMNGRVPPVSATIVGNGEYKEELQNLAGELGVSDRVRFAGEVPNDELPRLLGTTSIYASAVPVDGVSASLLEAMARGCFPIVWDNEANRQWIENGSNGLLVPGGDPSGYAEAIAKALSDDGLRTRAGEINRGIVEERGDLSKNMRTIEAAYSELVESFRRRH